MDFRRSPIHAALLAVTIACGPERSTADAVPEDDFVPAAAAEVCDLQVQCGCADAEPTEQCQGPLTQLFEMFLMPPADAGLTYDAECGGRVVEAYQEVGCDAVGALDEASECAPCKPYYGDKQRDQACTSFDFIFDDCARGLACVGEVCVDPCEPAAQGEACLGRDCGAGLVCSISADPDSGDLTSECVPTAGPGESCESLGCAEGLYCNASFECAALPTLGEPCEYDCAEGSWCDTSAAEPADHVCRAPKGEGEPCTADGECTSDECDGDAGTCVAATPLVCELIPD